MKKRVLMLMSDTGGGHRAAAEAIRDALFIRYGEEQLDVQLVDVFRSSHFPYNYMPEFYPWWVNHGKTAWGMSYNLSNTRRRAAVLSSGMYLTNSRKFKRLIDENPADVVVCVHSVVARPLLRAYMSTLEQRPPFITVVTDLVSTHMFWYDPKVERCLVPTQPAYDRGLACGLSPEQLKITGLPVHPGFASALTTKDEARRELEWDPDLPAVLMVAGGDGMGPVYETARAINAKRPKCQLIIVAGRNKSLKAKLESARWNQPTRVYPFVTNMPRLMAAADILVTKAGPATICEACIAGLPMILSDAIPGQETGNVDFVVYNHAGLYAPRPNLVADAVAAWLAEGKEGLQRRSQYALNAARPNAVWEIADEVWEWAQRPPIVNTRRKIWQDIAVKTRQIVSS